MGAGGDLSGESESRTWLEGRRLHLEPCHTPVLFVIGGSDKTLDAEMAAYFPHIREVLEVFSGTVVSGGTASGIPGLVGDATRALRNQGACHYDLVTYLPQKLPLGAEGHDSYRTVGRTPGLDFSESQFIAAWIDLLLGGIDPHSILALGINGGAIAHFEYRLALALGAQLAVVRDSGRAVDALLDDPEWRNHRRLTVISNDGMAAWVKGQR